MAFINALPAGGGGIKGSTIFNWMIDGVVDTSESMGGMVGNNETNGRNNLGTMEQDGYLEITNTSGGNGRAMISTQNYLTKDDYDYVLFHIIDMTTTTSNQPLTFGGKTVQSATAPTVDTYTVGNVSLSDVWVAAPLTVFNITGGNHYFAFGGTIKAKIDRILFVKIKS